MIHLLQIVDTANKVIHTVSAGDTDGDGSLSFFELIKMGGWIMIPLGIMLLLAVYVFVERTIAVRNVAKIDQNFMNIVRDHIMIPYIICITPKPNAQKYKPFPIHCIFNKPIIISQ